MVHYFSGFSNSCSILNDIIQQEILSIPDSLNTIIPILWGVTSLYCSSSFSPNCQNSSCNRMILVTWRVGLYNLTLERLLPHFTTLYDQLTLTLDITQTFLGVGWCACLCGVVFFSPVYIFTNLFCSYFLLYSCCSYLSKIKFWKK